MPGTSTSPQISRTTRQNIFDGLLLEKVSWRGQKDDVEFLQRLYDLSKLPSTDGRYKDAAGDIWQHCINTPEMEGRVAERWPVRKARTGYARCFDQLKRC